MTTDTRLKGSRKYPSLPAISDDPKSHATVIRALTEAVQIHERRTSDIGSSFVRVQDLIDMNLISVKDGRFNIALPLGASGSDGSGSNSYAFFVGG